MLGMSEREFWSTTPRKFFALVKMHQRANDPEAAKEAQNNAPMSASKKPTLQEAKAWMRK